MRNTLTRTFALRLGILPLVSFLAASASAQEAMPSPTVQIIPQPRQLTMTQQRFPLGIGASVVRADQNSEDDRFASQDFIDDLKGTASVPVKMGRGRVRHPILIGTIDLPPIQAALKRAGMESPANLDSEGYVLSVTAD